MKYFGYVLWVLLILLVTSFSSLNSHLVELNYYLGSASFSLSLLLLISLSIGLFLGVLMMLPTVVRGKYRKRKLHQLLKQNEAEIRNLRTFPFKDDH